MRFYYTPQMKRYSLMWWSVVLPTSVVVGGSTFLLAGFLTDWSILERAAVAVVLTVVADLTIAAWIQSVAPTRVNIGPGETMHDSELPSETARIIGGFESSSHGHVSVRGETWRAMRAPDDAASLSIGMDVNIVARDGLTLVVSSNTR
jgi:membrane protein implicated in regulation of membrane protease activity